MGMLSLFLGNRSSVSPTPPTTDAVKTGTGGIDPSGKGRKRVPFKPTGLVDRPKIKLKQGRKEVSDRVDESREIQAEITARLAREFGEENQDAEATLIALQQQKRIEELNQAQIDFEIGALLRKKIQEDELMLVLMMAAVS